MGEGIPTARTVVDFTNQSPSRAADEVKQAMESGTDEIIIFHRKNQALPSPLGGYTRSKPESVNGKLATTYERD